MVDKVVGVFVTALIVTAVGITFRPKSSAPTFVKNLLSGFAAVEKATYGPG